MAWLVAVFAVAAAVLACDAAYVNVTVESDASYSVNVSGVNWLNSGPTFVQFGNKTFSTAEGTLHLKNVADVKGSDTIGSYVRYDITWTLEGGQTWVTFIKAYDSAVVFGQYFPTQFDGTSVGTNAHVLSSFPSFAIEKYPQGQRGFLSYQGDMCGSGAVTASWDTQSSKIGKGVTGSGPIVLFNEDASTSVVISAYSNFMVHSQDVENNILHYGILGSVEYVPAGFVIETILVASEGINTAMLTWGDALLGRYGKTRDGYKKDFILTHLGYSTDNGAYYYYQTEPGKNYEDTLIDVKQYAVQQGIPYTYVLLDSWWYYKGTVSGVCTWDAMPSVFPHGLEYFYNVTGWPQQLHNRYWSANTTYAKQNGGKWDFLIESNGYALPTDPKFWDMLITGKTLTGMLMYEQDWLDVQFDNFSPLQTSPTLARDWMMQMGEAVARAGATMQECMSHVRHVLQSVELPAITNARASGDYHPGNDQWKLGVSSLLAHAVGIAPSKDNYWSTDIQDGTHYGPSTNEPYNRMQAAVSTFSTGPVAPSDKIGSSDVQLIMRSCMLDGTLLQPTVPATLMDPAFLFKAFGPGAGAEGELWSSYTQLPNYKTSFVLAMNLASDYGVSIDQLGYPSDTQLVALEANSSHTAILVDQSHQLLVHECGLYDFQVYTLSPIVSGWALLGEASKWVSVSSMRFSDLEISTDGLAVTLQGTPTEAVTASVYRPDGSILATTCTIADGSKTRLFVNANGGTCLPL